MVFPLIALFLGTGNQTANVSCAILERQFNDPNMKLWDFDSDTQLPNLPAMFTFPNLHDFYEDWRRNLESKGVEVRLRTDVAEILQRNGQGIVLATRPFDAEANDWKGEYTGPASKTETFDELVMCVLADDTLKLLGKTATFKERFVLGGTKFFDDIAIMHSDSKYFQEHYETALSSQLRAEPKSKTQSDQIAFARGLQRGPNNEPAGYPPMYYTRNPTLKILKRSRCRSTARTTSINSAGTKMLKSHLWSMRTMCSRVYFWIRGIGVCGRWGRLTMVRLLRGSGGINSAIGGSIMLGWCRG